MKHRLDGAATETTHITRICKVLLLLTSVRGDKGLREESSESSRWYIYISYPLQSFNFLYCGTNIISVYHDNLQAARETGALKEAKDKLEKRVEELTWRLGLEKRLRVISLLITILLEIW